VARAVRIAYAVNVLLILLLFCYLLIDPLHRFEKDFGIGFALFLGGVFLFPFLEIPMVAICTIGLIKDRPLRVLYVVTALMMIGGLYFAFFNRNMALP
jgi:hypothetical protein